MKGRDGCFQCIYCGRFVSYDRRKTTVQQITTERFDNRDGIYYPEYEVEMFHKKCKLKTK